MPIAEHHSQHDGLTALRCEGGYCATRYLASLSWSPYLACTFRLWDLAGAKP